MQIKMSTDDPGIQKSPSNFAIYHRLVDIPKVIRNSRYSELGMFNYREILDALADHVEQIEIPSLERQECQGYTKMYQQFAKELRLLVEKDYTNT
jgi:hypothetical protein